MCNICAWCGWMLDLAHKLVTWTLGCIIILMLCLGFLVTLTAGVAYGYNYSIAEFMHVARIELQRYRGNQPANPNIGEHYWWDNMEGSQLYVRQGGREGNAMLKEGQSAMLPPDVSRPGDAAIHHNTEPSYADRNTIPRPYYEMKKTHWVDKNEGLSKNMEPVRITPPPPTSSPIHRDVLEPRTLRNDLGGSSFDTRPRFLGAGNLETTLRTTNDPYMFTNMKVMGEEHLKGLQPSQDSWKPFMMEKKEDIAEFPGRTTAPEASNFLKSFMMEKPGETDHSSRKKTTHDARSLLKSFMLDKPEEVRAPYGSHTTIETNKNLLKSFLMEKPDEAPSPYKTTLTNQDSRNLYKPFMIEKPDENPVTSLWPTLRPKSKEEDDFMKPFKMHQTGDFPGRTSTGLWNRKSAEGGREMIDKPFMLAGTERGPHEPQAETKPKPSPWNRKAAEGDLGKPFMLAETAKEFEAEPRKGLADLTDYSEYGEEETYKKPV